MFLKFIFIISIFFNLNAHATTPSDCARRSSSAYGSAIGSDSDRAAVGSIVASECFKEFRKPEDTDSSIGTVGWIIIILISGGIIFIANISLDYPFRYATTEEIKKFLKIQKDLFDYLNRDKDFTDEMLEIRKNHELYLKKSLDKAVAGKNKIKWHKFKEVIAQDQVVSSKIIDLRDKERKKNRDS